MLDSHMAPVRTQSGEQRAFAPPGSVVGTSGALSGWRGFIVEHVRLPALDTPLLEVPRQIVTLQLSPPLLVEWSHGGRYMGSRFQPGDIKLTPAGFRHALRWRDNHAESIICQLDAAFLASALPEAGEAGSLNLQKAQGIQDERIAPILMALRADMEAGYSGGRLYGETLATALAAHLAQHYASIPPKLARADKPLGRSELRRALDYIHDNLESDISLHDIARAAGLSPSHLTRLFRQATGQPPHRYALVARIERAQTLLRQPGASVMSVSVRLGFYDEAHFVRHFKRLTGITPGAWRAK